MLAQSILTCLEEFLYTDVAVLTTEYLTLPVLMSADGNEVTYYNDSMKQFIPAGVSLYFNEMMTWCGSYVLQFVAGISQFTLTHLDGEIRVIRHIPLVWYKCVFTLNDVIYMVGCVPGYPNKRSALYKLCHDRWAYVTVFPEAVEVNVCAVVYENGVYIVGVGTDGDVSIQHYTTHAKVVMTVQFSSFRRAFRYRDKLILLGSTCISIDTSTLEVHDVILSNRYSGFNVGEKLYIQLHGGINNVYEYVNSYITMVGYINTCFVGELCMRKLIQPYFEVEPV